MRRSRALPPSLTPALCSLFSSQSHSALFRIGQMNNVELDDELLDPVSGLMSPAPTDQGKEEGQHGRQMHGEKPFPLTLG